MNKLFYVVAAAVVAGIAVLSMPHKNVSQSSGVEVLTGIDVSDSVRQEMAAGGTQLGRSIAFAARMGMLLDDRDQLTIFRVARQTEEFYDDKAPSSRDKFQWLLIRHTKPKAAKDGTFPAKFWTEAANRAEHASLPMAVAYLGDADNDDLTMESRQEITKAAERLAKSPAVGEVSIFGANPKNWETLRSEFASLDAKGILHIYPVDKMSPTDFIDRVQAIRRAPEAKHPGKSSP